MVAPAAGASVYDVFSVPHWCPYDTSSVNEFTKKASEYFDDHKQDWIAAANKQVLATIEANKNCWHGTVGAEDAVSKWPWGAVSGFFDNTSGTKPVMHIIRSGYPDYRKEVCPFFNQRQALQVIFGSVCVVVVDAAFAMLNVDLEAALKDAHHAVLAQYPSFFLEAGDSLVVPLGHTCLYFGVTYGADGKLHMRKPAKGQKPESAEYCAFMVHTPFDKVADATHPAEIRLFALASLISSLNRIPASIRARVEDWRKAMDDCRSSTADAANASA